MRPGSHAAGDGSFGRSAGIQVGRATVLLVIAVLIGLVLLHRSPRSGGLVAAGGTTTTNSGDALATDTTVRPSTNTTARPGSSNTTTTQPPRAKADIKVLVANGTSTSGLASTVSTTLRGKGYNTLASTNSNLKVASTNVYFQPGYQADAAVLAGALGLPPTAVQPMPATLPVASVNGVNILVVVGPDLASGSKPTTSTTVK